MKWVVAATLAVALGFGLGWRRPVGEAQASPDSQPSPPIAPSPSPSPQSTPAAPVETQPTATDGWRAWVERIRNADNSEELEAIHHEVAALEQKEAQLRKTLQQLLASRWVEVDPAGGLEFLESLERAETDRRKRNPWPKIFLMKEWVLADMQAAVTGIMSLEEGSRDGAFANLTAELMAISPELCIGFMRETGLVPKHVFNENLWLAFARRKPDEFRELALEIERKNADDESRSRYVGRWISIAASAMANTDPQATLAWIDELPGNLRSPAMKGLLEVWAESDPLAAAEHLDELKPVQRGPRSYGSSGSREIAETIIKSLAKEDLEGAVKFAAKNSDGLSAIGEVMAGLLKTGKMSTQAAFELIAKTDSPGERIRLNVLRRMWRGLPPESLGEAFDWLRTHPDEGPRGLAIAGVLHEWIKSDPAGLAEHLESTTSGSERGEFARQALDFMSLNAHDGSTQKLLEVLPIEERPSAISVLFKRQLDTRGGDPSHTRFDTVYYADAILESPESPARSKASAELAQLWGTTDPIGAMAWASQLPGPDSAAAIGAAASGWAKYDTVGLSEHLLEMRPGSGRDAGTVELVNAVHEAEPDSAWQWTMQIENPEQRLAAQLPTIVSWAKRDPAAAGAAVAEANLSERAREALRAVVTTP